MHNRDNWEDLWSRFAASAAKNPAQWMRHRLIGKLLQRHLDSNPTRLLDIGSGQGDLLFRLRGLRPWAGMLGIELSQSGVEISRRKVPEANFVVANLYRPPPELQKFSHWGTAAVCSEVLEHLDDPASFLRAAHCYLADQALLIVTVPGGPISAFDRYIGHRQHFTKASIEELLHRSEFEIEDTFQGGFPFFNLYRCLVVARGKKLIADVDASNPGGLPRSAWLAMALFHVLFHFNLENTPFGWQIIVVARKKSGGDDKITADRV
jgi:SAM-dependent methyltransferase